MAHYLINLALLIFNIFHTGAIVDEDVQPWIYKLAKSLKTPVCNAPMYMGVVKNNPITKMTMRDTEDFHKYLFSSVDLKSEGLRFVFANFSSVLYFNQSDKNVFGYQSSHHRPTKNMADLLYVMNEYVFPKKVHPQLAKVLLVITDIISENISGVLQEAQLLRKRGVYIVIAGVRNSVGDTSLLQRITNSKRDVHVYRTISELMRNLRDVLMDVCARASSFTRVRGLVVHPSFGPASGGTTLTIEGHVLATAKVKRIDLASLSCKLDRDRCEYITVFCVTKSAKGTTIVLYKALHLTVQFSDGRSMTVKYAFKYKPDPIINSVNPRTTILSGGILLTVSGRHLDSVAKPTLIVYMEFQGSLKERFTSEICDLVDGFNMTCPTPKLELPEEPTFLQTTTANALKDGGSEQPSSSLDYPDLRFYLGLELDGVLRYRRLSENLPAYSALKVYIDPKFEFFDQSPLLLKPGVSYLDIKGNKLTSGLTIGDFKVKVSDLLCEVVELNYNRLTFIPPKKSPEGISDYDGSYKVLVGVGYLSFSPGNIKYTNYMMNYIVIACTMVLFLILVSLLVVWCLKRSKNRLVEAPLDSKPPQKKLMEKDEQKGKRKVKDDTRKPVKEKCLKEKCLKEKCLKEESFQEKLLPVGPAKQAPPLPRRNQRLPKITANDGPGPFENNLYKVMPPCTK